MVAVRGHPDEDGDTFSVEAVTKFSKEFKEICV